MSEIMSQRPSKHLRPTVDNREDAIELIAAGLRHTASEFAESSSRTLDWARHECATMEAGPGALFTNGALTFSYGMSHACARLLAGDPGGWEAARDCMTMMYWAGELGQHYWLTEGVAYDIPTRVTKDLMSFHGLALAGQVKEHAAWQTPFLHNLIVGGSAESDVFEQDLVAFYRELTKAMLCQRWPSEHDLPSELGDFRALLATAGKAGSFEVSLVSYCDFRLSRAFQFNDAFARKPRRSTDTMFVFESQWLALFPFELFSLKGAYQAVTGEQLSLVAPHPLLHTPLMQVPELAPLADTSLARELQAYGQRCFGERWRPLTRVPSLAV